MSHITIITKFSTRIHMSDALMLLCQLVLRTQTGTRIYWQCAFHNEILTMSNYNWQRTR